MCTWHELFFCFRESLSTENVDSSDQRGSKGTLPPDSLASSASR